jgi:hypothetical protein
MQVCNDYTDACNKMHKTHRSEESKKPSLTRTVRVRPLRRWESCAAAESSPDTLLLGRSEASKGAESFCTSRSGPFRSLRSPLDPCRTSGASICFGTARTANKPFQTLVGRLCFFHLRQMNNRMFIYDVDN